jgi:hypothetical protein
MPISRVRSVTLTSMMFMMPIPPHQQRNTGDGRQQHGHGVGRGGEHLVSSDWLCTTKSSSSPL